ncbi:MAG: monofunctional biosynthetic peptidoglycan transglycosylase [Paracoccaceae bacterium]|nr:monofunctional biosynthetic peptidoglycan transglycosylase [Paracoccaceae bacterium]
MSKIFNFRRILRVLKWVSIGMFCGCIFAVTLYVFTNPKTTGYMKSEEKRLGEIKYNWIDIVDMRPVFLRSVVAAEDANFCLHWGLDLEAIRQAIESGADRGASTITQQVVKNIYLWPERSWIRKALEAAISPFVELLWSKGRIIEVYLNIAEFDEGVFGIKAAAKHYFGVLPAQLSTVQSASLAAVLPNPKERSAIHPSKNLIKRAASIQDGAETIRLDGRDDCFE